MGKFKKASMLALAAVLSFSFASCSAGGGKDADVTTIIVGTRGTLPPYTYVDAENKLTGYDVEVLCLIESRVPGVHFEFQTMDLAACFVALDAGQIDLIANQLVHNQDRDSKYLFTQIPYCYAYTRLVVRDDDDSVTTIEDLKGKTVAITATSEGARLLREFNETADPKIILRNFDGGSAETLPQLATGQVDATTGYKATVETAVREQGLKIKIVGEPITGTPTYFILRQDDAARELIAKLDVALQSLIDDGTLAQLSIRFLGEDDTRPVN